MHFGSLIITIESSREALQVTQEALATLLGVGLCASKQFESGRDNPILQTLQKLAETLVSELTPKINLLND